MSAVISSTPANLVSMLLCCMCTGRDMECVHCNAEEEPQEPCSLHWCGTNWLGSQFAKHSWGYVSRYEVVNYTPSSQNVHTRKVALELVEVHKVLTGLIHLCIQSWTWTSHFDCDFMDYFGGCVRLFTVMPHWLNMTCAALLHCWEWDLIKQVKRQTITTHAKTL